MNILISGSFPYFLLPIMRKTPGRKSLSRHCASMNTASCYELGDLVRDAQAGSSDAATKVYERCRRPLLAAIRRVMSPELRRLFDSDDFLIDALTEVFLHQIPDEVLK